MQDDVSTFSVHVSRSSRKYSMMKFNVPVEMPQDRFITIILVFTDLSYILLSKTDWKWNKKDVEIERDMSKKRAYDLRSEGQPQFGVGSEYRAREKEIARKMTLGHRIHKFDIDAQTWKLALSDFEKEGKGGKPGKKKTRKFTGSREGDVTQNSMYFVMHQKEGQIFEAFKIEVISCLKYLLIISRTGTNSDRISGTELWRMKKLKKNGKDEISWWTSSIWCSLWETGTRKKAEWSQTSRFSKLALNWNNNKIQVHQLADEMGFDEDEFAANRSKAGRGKKNVGGKQKGGAAFEDSDDGDGEGDEVDYMSDDSSDFDVNEDDKPELKGINEDLSDREVSSSSGEEEEEDDKKDTQEQEVSLHRFRIHANVWRTRTNQMSKIQTLKTLFQNQLFSNSATSRKSRVL
jgi:transcription initiation factor TFIIF subunit alpha